MPSLLDNYRKISPVQRSSPKLPFSPLNISHLYEMFKNRGVFGGAIDKYEIPGITTVLDPDGFPIDLTKPYLEENGHYATEETLTFPIEGRWYNIPSIWDGKKIENEENVLDRGMQALQSGHIFPNYPTRNKALIGAKKRSDAIGREMGLD